MRRLFLWEWWEYKLRIEYGPNLWLAAPPHLEQGANWLAKFSTDPGTLLGHFGIAIFHVVPGHLIKQTSTQPQKAASAINRDRDCDCDCGRSEPQLRPQSISG